MICSMVRSVLRAIARPTLIVMGIRTVSCTSGSRCDGGANVLGDIQRGRCGDRGQHDGELLATKPANQIDPAAAWSAAA